MCSLAFLLLARMVLDGGYKHQKKGNDNGKCVEDRFPLGEHGGQCP